MIALHWRRGIQGHQCVDQDLEPEVVAPGAGELERGTRLARVTVVACCALHYALP
jgi:hypothetical protein